MKPLADAMVRTGSGEFDWAEFKRMIEADPPRVPQREPGALYLDPREAPDTVWVAYLERAARVNEDFARYVLETGSMYDVDHNWSYAEELQERQSRGLRLLTEHATPHVEQGRMDYKSRAGGD